MIEFRKSSRALVLTKENKISLEALKRELLEETGSQVAEISFLFHLDDVDMRNSVDFYIAKEVSRGIPSGSEWELSNEQNKYELYEASIEELDKMNIKPKIVKKALINALKKELGAK